MMTMRIGVEITPNALKVSTMALSELFFELGNALRSPNFYVLQGPPQVRNVLLKIDVVDLLTDTVLTGELVTAPNQQ